MIDYNWKNARLAVQSAFIVCADYISGWHGKCESHREESQLMKIDDTQDPKCGFKVLQTAHCQAALMVLAPGEASLDEMSVHKNSDQVLLLLEGELCGEIADETFFMRQGDSCIVVAGTPHRFKNIGEKTARTFNIYSPPAY